MYKVFFNDSTIRIDAQSKTSSKNNIIQIAVNEDHVFADKLLARIEAEGVKQDFVILNDNPQKLWKSFRKQLTELPAAGGLVINEHRELLFIKRLGVWDLPKGKIEKKESPENAAIREVEEECGIKGLQIIRQLDSTFHIYRNSFVKSPNNLVLKETKWFLMSAENNQSLTPQTEENIEEVRWFALHELDQVMENTYSSIREFLQKTLPLL
ncbi:MAG TPA: NUDIX domain-containing protein [Prolixibacteraceae bacterium]|nr:NUDIX domain-containing protein [Prolixibacteraceae bacterium]